MDYESYDVLLKFLLIGDSYTGKTHLLFRYTDDYYRGTYIGSGPIDFKIMSLRINDVKVKMQIWDASGNECFRTITSSYYRDVLSSPAFNKSRSTALN